MTHVPDDRPAGTTGAAPAESERWRRISTILDGVFDRPAADRRTDVHQVAFGVSVETIGIHAGAALQRAQGSNQRATGQQRAGGSRRRAVEIRHERGIIVGAG